MLDIDMTGLPCGPRAELSRKGYFSKEGIRHGRQLSRVVSGATQEVVADLLFAGNVQLNTALRSLVAAAEDVLLLDRWRRSRTVLRGGVAGGRKSQSKVRIKRREIRGLKGSGKE